MLAANEVDELKRGREMKTKLDENARAAWWRKGRVLALGLCAGAGVALVHVDAPEGEVDTAWLVAEASAQEAADQTAPSRAEKIAQDMQEYYAQTRDFMASFRQVYTDIAAGEEKVSRGQVYFKKPGKMRWDYYKPDARKREKLIVSDGSVLWVYEYDFRQVFKRCLASSQLPTALSFLMGEGDLLEQFDVGMGPGSQPGRPVLALTPKKPTSRYTKIEMEIDVETNQVRRTKIFDPYGNTNEIIFEERKVNQNLPDSGFAFEPPKDARLLNPAKECP